jgi:hypothetical protein
MLQPNLLWHMVEKAIPGIWQPSHLAKTAAGCRHAVADRGRLALSICKQPIQGK